MTAPQVAMFRALLQQYWPHMSAMVLAQYTEATLRDLWGALVLEALGAYGVTRRDPPMLCDLLEGCLRIVTAQTAYVEHALREGTFPQGRGFAQKSINRAEELEESRRPYS